MEAQCFQGIVDWMNNAATSKKYPHAPITSWFYWAYNPDSGGVDTIMFNLQAANGDSFTHISQGCQGQSTKQNGQPSGEIWNPFMVLSSPAQCTAIFEQLQLHAQLKRVFNKQ